MHPYSFIVTTVHAHGGMLDSYVTAACASDAWRQVELMPRVVKVVAIGRAC